MATMLFCVVSLQEEMLFAGSYAECEQEINDRGASLYIHEYVKFLNS